MQYLPADKLGFDARGQIGRVFAVGFYQWLLYERLGFREFRRVPEKHPKQSGLNFYVYMRREMNAR
jgi:hypothetical protein